MPYKILFLFTSIFFFNMGYADCSPEDIARIKSVWGNNSNIKVTFISKDDKCRYTVNSYGRFESSKIYFNDQGMGLKTVGDGPVIEWYDNGQKKSEGNVSMDKITGLKTTWHKNGVKQSEANYSNNVIDGKETIWNDKGEKISEVMYVNGLRKTDQSLSGNEPNETSSQDPIEIAKNTCKKLGLKEKTEKFGICVLKNIGQ